MSPHSLRRQVPISLVEGGPTIAETLARIRPRDHFMSQCEISLKLAFDVHSVKWTCYG